MVRQQLNPHHRARSDTALARSLARLVRPLATGVFSVAVAGLTNLAFTERAAAQTWNGGPSGFWNDASHWSPAVVPNAVDAVATFVAVDPDVSWAVVVGGPFTIGTLNLNSSAAHSNFFFQPGVFPSGTLIMQVSAGSAAINVQSNSSEGYEDFGGNVNLQLNSNTVLTTASAAEFRTTGLITGVGALTIAGSGIVRLEGANTYTGATTVNGGLLVVDGSIASSILTTVNASGRLTGVGGVGVTQINAGGLVAPGAIASPGTSMTLTSLAMQSGAQYVVSVNPATSTFANVTGNANLGGATVAASFAAGSYVAKQYTILNAGSITGTFDPTVLNSGLPSGFHTTLGYDAAATQVYLNLVLSFVPPSGNLNPNQQNVGNALTNFFNSNGTIPIVFGSLTPTGLTQLSGEVGSAPQQSTFNAMNQFMGIMTDPFIAGRGEVGSVGGGTTGYADEELAYAAKRKRSDALAAIYTKAAPPIPFVPRWSVWTAAYGGSQTTDGNATTGSNTATSNIYGTAVGADYRFSPSTIAGFSLAGGGTNFSVANSGYGRSDLFQAGAFVRHTIGAAYVSGVLAYGWQDITANRIVTIAGTDQLQARFNANAYSGRLEGGYRFLVPRMNGVGFTPYAAGQFTTFELPAYAEGVISGTNTFALAYGTKSVTDTRSELGLRTDKSFAMQTAILTLRGRVSWAHDFNSDRGIGATFQTLPGASFFVNGAAQASDSALTTASAETKWMNDWSSAATFEGEFSNVTRSYAGKGVVRYAW